MNIKLIGQKDWIQRWAGSYTFISCDYWGLQYFKSLKRDLGVGFRHSLFVHKKGTVSFFLLKKEFDKFGEAMAKKATTDISFTKRTLSDLKVNADKINFVMDDLCNEVPSVKQYKNFLVLYDKHLALHNFMKKTVDFLTEKELKKLFPIFKDARIYSENVYSKTESFFRSLSLNIAIKSGYKKDYLTCLTSGEIQAYLLSKKLPKEAILKSRFFSSALYFENGKRQIIIGHEVDLLEKSMLSKNKMINEIKGNGVCPGIISGVVRIIPDPFNFKKFNEGDILVTGMTRPEFLILAKKSGAIVTDSGGALCHAAITARELNKPCIVGTQIATKILHDGDIVEVDSQAGIVRKI